MNKLTKKVAERIAAKIKEQYNWIENQENTVTESILGDVNQYDLRQNIQALETGKRTLTALKDHFEEFAGISYDDYCATNPEAVKVKTAEEKLLEAIKEIINGKEPQEAS